ncbi:MAG: DUF5818 domain-containing protein [Janthinobacterium lividum]
MATANGFALAVDDGGCWQLDVRDYRATNTLLNRRVTVNGRRSGFDLLDVETITT